MFKLQKFKMLRIATCKENNGFAFNNYSLMKKMIIKGKNNNIDLQFVTNEKYQIANYH